MSQLKQKTNQKQLKPNFLDTTTDIKLEIGVDEAGRGCYLGRVYAGAVMWDNTITSNLIKDSKKLDHRKRLIAYDFIKENCPAYGHGYAEVEEIDRINILQANMNAMHRAIKSTNITPAHILVDGTFFNFYEDQNGNTISHTTVVQGDNTYLSIAAASIIAKVERDLYIDKLCDTHPILNEYGLKNNKGYGTQEHRKAIELHGLTEFHRKSFDI